MRHLAFSAVLMAGLSAPAFAQQAEAPMTVARIGEIVRALDPGAGQLGTGFKLTLNDVPVLIITDPVANRMQTLVPVRSAEGMTETEILCVLQANFDTALDARYAVGRGRLWGTFIHPLSPLEKDQFISALGQTVNLALTYGTLFTGGALSFGGGDSQSLQRDLIDELLKRGPDI